MARFSPERSEYIQGAGTEWQSYPLLITGGEGALAQALARACAEHRLPYRLLSRDHMDIADPARVEAVLDHYRPYAVLNAAGYTAVGLASMETYQCYRDNAKGPITLALACAERGIRVVGFSSAMVFDGEKQPLPYVESDPTHPRTVYGASKAVMERHLRQVTADQALILRTSAFFGRIDARNFLTRALCNLANQQTITVPGDEFLTPAYLPDLADHVLNLLMEGKTGIWHVAHPEPISRAELIARAATFAGLDRRLIRVMSREKVSLGDEEPLRWAVLDTERHNATPMPPLDDALARFTQDAAYLWTLPSRPGVTGVPREFAGAGTEQHNR